MLDICFKWTEENGMEFNIEKSVFHSDPYFNNNNDNDNDDDDDDNNYDNNINNNNSVDNDNNYNNNDNNDINNSNNNSDMDDLLFYLGSEENRLPKKEYKYLRFIHRCSGINWKEHLDNSVERSYL